MKAVKGAAKRKASLKMLDHIVVRICSSASVRAPIWFDRLNEMKLAIQRGNDD